MSQYDFPKEIWIIIPTSEAIIKITTIIPVVLIGVFGNCLLLNIISRNRALRTPTNFLLANMAAADLATLLFCPLMFICKDLFQNYIMGSLGCKLEGYLQGKQCAIQMCLVSSGFKCYTSFLRFVSNNSRFKFMRGELRSVDSHRSSTRIPIYDARCENCDGINMDHWICIVDAVSIVSNVSRTNNSIRVLKIKHIL